MSWLRNHIRHFVVPGLRSLAQNNVPIQDWMTWVGSPFHRGTWKDVLASDIKPFEGKLRPSKKCKHPEAGLVYSAVCSFFRDKKFQRQAFEILQECSVEHFMPHGRVLGINAGVEIYSGEDIIHSIIKRSWRSLKEIAQGRTILLPGRDVWPWEVLARKDNYPSIFDPRISRIFCSDPKVLRDVCLSWDVNLDEALLFDTGFAGSIPTAMSAATGAKIDFLMLSSHSNSAKNWKQIFPNHKGARSKVLCIEYFPKYYKTGKVVEGQPAQFLSHPLEFVKTAALTIWLQKHKSPKFIVQHPNQRKGKEREEAKCLADS